ncbi:MAG: hypothetical protein HY019_03670 [Aquabacterium sp.]|uniref:GNAT family N-acetyltransferase n=1 Tax=Aquabacterium sp. TaxID=1872578 RepID=UPI0025C64BF6|nr:hypothetical protein [Aquabacterium sp.]MBI3381084.1 hypothetical protein [Aquabacterium sp.]
MPVHALADLADQNLAHAVRLHSRWQPAAKLLELNGVLLHQGTLPLPLPHQNCVIRLDASVRPELLLQQAHAFFGGQANPYAVITMSRQDLDLDACLDAQGFTAHADLPAMLTDAPLAMPPTAPGWRIDLLTQAAELPAFVKVCAKAYATLGLPEFMTPSFFVDTEGLLAPDVSIALARDAQGQVAATAMVLHTGEVAGLYWVGTLPEARGTGLAAACTVAVTNLALERGAKGVTLQATHLGEPTYRRLGFREYGRMTRWSL